MGKRSREDEVPTDDDSNLVSSVPSPAKIQEVDVSVDTSPLARMQCSLPPHPPVSFSSTAQFDIHYAKEHTNRCSSCGKNFPSAHYLALHIDENHNPLREALAAQGEKTYACFVESCDRKCSAPGKRRLHLIDKHMFPKAYNFRIVDYGIDKTGSMLLTGQRRRLSTNSQPFNRRRSSSLIESSPAEIGSTASTPATQSTPDDIPSIAKGAEDETRAEVHELENALASLQFVPPSVRARQRDNRKK